MYQDSSAITIIDSRTTRVCATLNCNYIPADDLADVLYVLVKQYMPNAVINVERNGAALQRPHYIEQSVYVLVLIAMILGKESYQLQHSQQ